MGVGVGATVSRGAVAGENWAVRHDDTARDALAHMHVTGVGVVAVVDAEGVVVGTVTDGDVRRVALAGTDLAIPVIEILSRDPAIVSSSAGDDEVLALIRERHIDAAAVVDGGTLVAMRTLADLQAPGASRTAVIMAGGRGQRLQPLTDRVPKPLLTVGSTTIVERLLGALSTAGVNDVYLAVNYKAEVFEERLGTGEAYGVTISYLHEHKKLGTAGALSLLRKTPTEPFLVLNADMVTTLDMARLLDFHAQQGAALTVASFDHRTAIPYGVLTLEGERVVGLEEKPQLRSRCNAGLYVLDPGVVRLVPRNTAYDMPSLVQAVIDAGMTVAAFPIIEKFFDIGSPAELERVLLYFATGEEDQDT
ncbi:MAG: nucleotidyltransferase family protein [Acidimicrobiales bacterium]